MSLILASLPAAFAATTAPGLRWAACITVGLAAAVVGWWIGEVLRSEDIAQGAEWRYDVSRINELRRSDPWYRLFQPLIGLLARFNRVLFPRSLAEIHREIQAAGLPRFWLPEEYLARAEMLALFAVPLYAFVLFRLLGLAGPLGWALTAAAVPATAWWLRHRLAVRAHARLRTIKRRMPFLLDLLTLLMEAGSSFLNAMREAVEEFRGHPVAEEFGRVLADLNMGKTRMEAFQAMRDRLADDEITSIIGSILQGELLGTPLAHIFRTQADVLRIKRTQRAELLAGEAGVNMLLPNILIMAATVLIIVGPFLLNYLTFGLAM
jgi:tight adherence protein C